MGGVIQSLGRARKMGAASFGDFRIGSYRLRSPGRKSLARRGGTKGAAELPEPGALWNRLGRAGSSDGVLRHGATIRENAQAIREQAHRVTPTGAGKTCVDDPGNAEGTIPAAAPWALKGQRQS